MARWTWIGERALRGGGVIGPEMLAGAWQLSSHTEETGKLSWGGSGEVNGEYNFSYLQVERVSDDRGVT